MVQQPNGVLQLSHCLDWILTILWLCENGVKSQSSDSVKRVTQSSNFLIAQKLMVTVPEKRKVRVGDWAIFKRNETKGRGRNKKRKRVFVGRVLSFRLINGTRQELKNTVFDWDGSRDGKANVGVQCDWYSIDHVDKKISGSLCVQPMFSHGFHPCNGNYVCSLPAPTLFMIMAILK